MFNPAEISPCKYVLLRWCFGPSPVPLLAPWPAPFPGPLACPPFLLTLWHIQNTYVSPAAVYITPSSLTVWQKQKLRACVGPVSITHWPKRIGSMMDAHHPGICNQKLSPALNLESEPLLLPVHVCVCVCVVTDKLQAPACVFDPSLSVMESNQHAVGPCTFFSFSLSLHSSATVLSAKTSAPQSIFLCSSNFSTKQKQISVSEPIDQVSVQL